MQFVFAGKAHPRDHGGKELIAEIIQHFAGRPELRRRIVFIEDYDINVARYLVQGVDVWLNNPRRPLEASRHQRHEGRALNGGLNLSILDGWWGEGYDGDNGWAIRRPSEPYAERRDQQEAGSLFDLLEHEIVPHVLRPHRGSRAPAVDRLAVKHTLASLGPKVTAGRMVRDYVVRLYEPAAAQTDAHQRGRLHASQDLVGVEASGAARLGHGASRERHLRYRFGRAGHRAPCRRAGPSR